VKEKVLAAYRAGLRQVLMPKANEKDLRDIPDEVKQSMTFTFVGTMDDVLHIALLPHTEPTLVDLVGETNGESTSSDSIPAIRGDLDGGMDPSDAEPSSTGAQV
jgi:ATP-dependent Lon protease